MGFLGYELNVSVERLLFMVFTLAKEPAHFDFDYSGALSFATWSGDETAAEFLNEFASQAGPVT